MQTTLLLITCILTVTTSIAQTHRTSFRSQERSINLEENAEKHFFYLFDDFQDARIYYPGQVSEARLNMNILNDQMILQRPGQDDQVLATTRRFDSIKINDQTFIHHRRFGYLEILQGARQNFYIKYHTSYSMQEIRQGAYGDAPATAAVQSVNVLAGQAHTMSETGEFLFLENQSGNPVRVSLLSRPTFGMIVGNEFVDFDSRRALNRQFPDHRSPIRSFLRNNDIEFDKREDLIQLAAFLEGLK